MKQNVLCYKRTINCVATGNRLFVCFEWGECTVVRTLGAMRAAAEKNEIRQIPKETCMLKRKMPI